MGLPALRHEPKRRGVAKPHLRLVPTGRTAKRPRKAASKRQRAVDTTAALRNFQLFAILVLTIGALGIGRVWLSVQATEASIQASSIRADIRDARYEGDMLEVRQSALGSPSRIRTIAGRAMGMAPANSVTYLDLTKKDERRQATLKASTVTSGAGLKGTLARIMDLTAGEAQVLLVGDVGLASGR